MSRQKKRYIFKYTKEGIIRVLKLKYHHTLKEKLTMPEGKGTRRSNGR